MTLREKLLNFSFDLADFVYDLSLGFPDYEKFGLGNQIRRAVVSIGANIAEGFGRDDKNDMKRFLRISYGSLCEVEYFMEFAKRRNFINEKDMVNFIEKSKDLARLLNSFSKK